MNEKYEKLKAMLLEIQNIGKASAVLYWDQATYMPDGGARARGMQLGTLSSLAHRKFTSPEIGKLLEDLADFEKGRPYDSFEACLIRKTRIDYERATKVPPEFMAEFMMHGSETNQVWVKARPANDFEAVRPYLEKTLDYSKRLANYFPGYEHIADPLIDMADYGMKTSEIRRIFDELRGELVPLVKAISNRPQVDDSFLHRPFDEDAQFEFGRKIAADMGYDFDRGRLDIAPHPFTISFGIGDVRITTRINPNDPGDCLFSSIHEAGHAMYEQGGAAELDGTPLAGGTSSGVHESQSRLWENIIGRSRGFWKHYYPKFQKTFRRQLEGVTLDDFYKAINRVQRSLIRTDADEVTYNLHVMLRFDLELDMLEDKLAIADLPAEWRARFERDMGIPVPDDRDGCLQDIHWHHSMIGGQFQGYTLGNIMSAQFYEAALKAHPEIPSEIERGQFMTLLSWLRENIYVHGSKFTANEIIERATGKPLTIGPYMAYLKEKYGEIYGLRA